MKRKYQEPEAEVIYFETADIITTSGEGTGNDGMEPGDGEVDLF